MRLIGCNKMPSPYCASTSPLPTTINLVEEQPLKQGRQRLWQELPTEVMCSMADYFLDLERHDRPEQCQQYPRPTNYDMTFAHLDRKARSVSVHALGKRQIIVQIRFHPKFI